jgi:hypothetical protein
VRKREKYQSTIRKENESAREREREDEGKEEKERMEILFGH